MDRPEDKYFVKVSFEEAKRKYNEGNRIFMKCTGTNDYFLKGDWNNLRNYSIEDIFEASWYVELNYPKCNK